MGAIRTICGAALLLFAAPGLAQSPTTGTIDAPAGQPFVHANSGMTFPAMLERLSRTRLMENEKPQLDVAAEYATASGDEVLTVYAYRATSGAVPIWFDRAAWAIENRPIYGTPLRRDAPPAFMPPGQAAASGMIAAWSLTGSRYRSTALAIVPLGEWLVKLRYSSVSRDAAALDAGLRSAIAALGWPQGIAPAPAASAVPDCTTPLAQKGRSKRAKLDGSAMLVGALLAGMPRPSQTSATAVEWCRDRTSVEGAGIYRAEGATDAYLYALSDAGRGVMVAPNAAAAFLPGAGGGKQSWSVDLVLPGVTVNYPPQDRLPDPAQIREILNGPALSSVTTWGKNTDVSVSPDAVK